MTLFDLADKLDTAAGQLAGMVAAHVTTEDELNNLAMVLMDWAEVARAAAMEQQANRSWR